MSLNPDGRGNKIKLISDTMTGFYSVMRNLQEDYATYHQNYSEEALALLSRSDDFIESVEAVRSLDSLSRIDDEGINELFLLSQQIAELYHLNVQERDKENPVTEVKSEKGFWQTVWGVMKGGRDSPIVRNSLEQVTGAIADIGDKIGNGLKSGVDWVIENEPDLPVYQRLCNPLFGFFMAGGAVQSWIQNRNLDNTSKNAVENSKAFQKGLADSFIEMGTGLLSLPKAVVDLYYKECEVGNDIAAYLDNCSPEQIPEDFRNWFNKSKEQVKEIGLELKKEVIRQLSEKDVKEYYETFGYLTGTIASFFIGAGEAKAASEAGKAGKIGKAAASETKATEQLAADVKKVVAKIEKKTPKTPKVKPKDLQTSRDIVKQIDGEIKIGKNDLIALRTKLGVPQTETVAIGKTNVKGLEKITFEGQSPKVRKEAGLPDLDEVWRNRNIKAPGQNPLFTRHAEEVLANSFDKAVIEAKIKPEDVRGVLKIHQSNPAGVCRKCIQGLDNDIVKPGVLKQLSLKYPNLRIEVTSEVLPNVKVSGKSNFVIMNGKYIQ